MSDDDEPKIVRPTPEEIATHGRRIIVNTPLGSSWFDDSWSTVNRNPEPEPTYEAIIEGFEAMKPMLAVSDALDRYMARLAHACAIPVQYLTARPVAFADRETGEAFRAMIGNKQFRMRARMWLTLKGPFRRAP